MKYLLITIPLSLTLLFAGDNKTKLKVDGMRCAYSCAGKVSTVVQNIKGVKECEVDFEKGIATVVYDEKKLDSKDIVNALNKKTYYEASEIKNQDTEKEKSSI